jgi:ribonuclease HI
MENQVLCSDRVSRVSSKEEDEEEFRSCCEDEDDLKEKEKDFIDEFSVKMFFKGVSITEHLDPVSSGVSGIGVFIERSASFPAIQIQKKLDFYVEESVADYLALMDGLSEAKLNNFKQVFAFTDSQILFNQIMHEEIVENPLIMALRQRIREQTGEFETFVLKLVPKVNLEKPLKLAQVAVGIVSVSSNIDDKLSERCSICKEEKLSCVMVKLKCSHKFCSNCVKTYVDEKVESSLVPVSCPESKCKYNISVTECKSFLPVTSFDSLIQAYKENNIFDSGYVSSEEFRNLPAEELDSGDLSLTENSQLKQCQQCRRMIELTHGCHHMTCWCGHEFCYSCGSEYRDSHQTCECMIYDEDAYTEEEPIVHPAQQFEQWAWDSFGSLSTMMDAYTEQERSQLELIQQFLAGGFSLSDHNPPPPPRCADPYVDTMKDLRQLPWLERFVSVISDNYYDDYTQ